MLLILVTGLTLLPAFADEGDPPPERRVVEKVAMEGYLWWLKQWSDGEEVCELLIGHDGIPTWDEVSKACGVTIFNEWKETPACTAAVQGKDSSSCEGLYLLFAGYLEGEYSVVQELPSPSIFISLDGCENNNISHYCIGDPTLIFTGIEPLENEKITAVHIEVNEEESFDCEGFICEINLAGYAGQIMQLHFWADSSYGDQTEEYTALVRSISLINPERSGEQVWQIEVLSTQWEGESVAACADTWESFPPIEPKQTWLMTPEDPDALATDQPFEMLAGRLLLWGFVEAPDCPWEGLMPDGTASVCGVESAQDAVGTWQNRFDIRIMQVAEETGIPAKLIKAIFAQESQFWPLEIPQYKEYGLGSLHPEGGDSLLLWDVSFYQQFCPQVLSADACTSRYHELDEESQELLRGALTAQANVRCPECPNGIDITKAEHSVNMFADLLMANCAQTGALIHQVSNKAPGEVFSYPDLWRLTLANYTAGPGCLNEALLDVKQAGYPFDWVHISQSLADMEACSGAIGYVERVTKIYP
jgi:hypothetical protein